MNPDHVNSDRTDHDHTGSPTAGDEHGHTPHTVPIHVETLPTEPTRIAPPQQEAEVHGEYGRSAPEPEPEEGGTLGEPDPAPPPPPPTGNAAVSGPAAGATGAPSSAGKDAAGTVAGESADLAGTVQLVDVTTGGDVNVSGRDTNVDKSTRYYAGAAFLKRRLLAPESELKGVDFVGAVPRPPEEGGVLVLIGQPGTGRRTAALKALDDRRTARTAAFVLYPDWDKPDVAEIPCERGTDYLLDLSGAQQRPSEEFHRALATYADMARSRRALLVIIADEGMWATSGTAIHRTEASLFELAHTRPDAEQIARGRISDFDLRNSDARVAWLTDEDSVFCGLPSPDASPTRAVELAAVVCDAKGKNDLAAKDRFDGWEKQLADWAAQKGRDTAERRVLRLAAAFLDGAPARVVLGAADRLLAVPAVHWVAPQGGPFALPSAAIRCAAAGLEYSSHRVSISDRYVGMASALIKWMWRDDPASAAVVPRWLEEISGSRGVAVDHCEQIAEALISLARQEGPDVVLSLVEKWLKKGTDAQAKQSADVIDRLAVDPALGAEVREDLANWARGSSNANRQRAVVHACRGRFGTDYLRVALTRLRYVIDSGGASGVRAEAAAVLAELVAGDEPGAVLETVVQWAATGAEKPSGRAIIDLFGDPDSGVEAARMLIGGDSPEAETHGALIGRGLKAAWDADLRFEVSTLLTGWHTPDDVGPLAEGRVADIILAVLVDEVDITDPDVSRMLGDHAPHELRLFERYITRHKEIGVRRAAEQERTNAGHAAEPTTEPHRESEVVLSAQPGSISIEEPAMDSESVPVVDVTADSAMEPDSDRDARRTSEPGRDSAA